jgi:hypothetical protein
MVNGFIPTSYAGVPLAPAQARSTTPTLMPPRAIGKRATILRSPLLHSENRAMSPTRNRSVLLVLAALAALALAGAARSVAQSSSATLPSSSVAWDGTLVKVAVRCELASGSCTGHLAARAPGASQSDELAAGDYSVAAGATKVLGLVPGPAESKRLDSLKTVVVRIAPSTGQGDPFEKTLQVEHRAAPGDGGSGDGGPPRRSRKHPRYLIFAGFTEKTTLIVWAGELYTNETRTAKCVAHKLLRVQKRVGRRWLTVGTIRTGAAKREHPGYSAKFSKLFPIDRSHRFRALAPRVKVGRQICLRATSRSLPGRGGKSPR